MSSQTDFRQFAQAVKPPPPPQGCMLSPLPVHSVHPWLLSQTWKETCVDVCRLRLHLQEEINIVALWWTENLSNSMKQRSWWFILRRVNHSMSCNQTAWLKLESKNFVRSGIWTHASIWRPEVPFFVDGIYPWVWRPRPLGHPDKLADGVI